MNKIARIVLACLSVYLFVSMAETAPPPRLAWEFAGPSNPEFEWVTMSTTGGGNVFTVLSGKSWTFTTENGTFTETGSEVAALDLASGQKQWSFQTQFPVGSPLLYVDGKLIIHDGYGDLFCLEAATGREVWKVERELHMGPWDEQTMPSAKDGFIYLREENELLCRSLKDGTPVWRSPLEAVDNRRVFPALVDGTIVLSTAMDDALGLSSEDGRVLWKKNIGWLKENVVAGGKYAFFANSDELRCLTLADGAEVWSYVPPPLEASPGPQQQAPERAPEEVWNVEKSQALAAEGGNLFVIQKRVEHPIGNLARYEIACLRMADKSPVWTYTLQDQFAGFSLSGRGAIVVQGAKVTLLSLEDGSPVWDYQVPGEKSLQGQAMAVAGKILVIGKKGLYCIDTGDPRVTGWPQCGGSAGRSGRTS